jgi:hypothetical protein
MAPRQRTSPIHAHISGRARYKIRGLQGNSLLKDRLEGRLASNGDIHSVSASVLTGNLLILFNADRPHADMAALIEAILQNDFNP